MLVVMQWFLLFAAFACIIRLLLGATVSDRLVALNVLAGVSLALLVLWGVKQERVLYLDVALVYDIFGFIGLLAITRFLKDRPSEGEDL